MGPFLLLALEWVSHTRRVSSRSYSTRVGEGINDLCKKQRAMHKTISKYWRATCSTKYQIAWDFCVPSDHVVKLLGSAGLLGRDECLRLGSSSSILNVLKQRLPSHTVDLTFLLDIHQIFGMQCWVNKLSLCMSITIWKCGRPTWGV